MSEVGVALNDADIEALAYYLTGGMPTDLAHDTLSDAGRRVIDYLGTLVPDDRWLAVEEAVEAHDIEWDTVNLRLADAVQRREQQQPSQPSQPLRNETVETVRSALHGATGGFAARLAEATCSLADLAKRYTANIEWLAEGYIALGELTIVPGPPESLKSWLMADLARAVSTPDGMWLGSFRVKHGHVVYFEQERAKNLVYQTQRLATSPHSLSRVSAVEPCGIDLCDMACQTALTEMLTVTKPLLVIFNSYKAIFRGRPADSADVSRALQWLGSLAERLNEAIVIVDGTNKLGALGRSRGMEAHADSVQKEYEADTILHVERKRDEVGRGTGPSRVYVGKRRHGEAGPPFVFDVQRIDNDRSKALCLGDTSIERDAPVRPSSRTVVLESLPPDGTDVARKDIVVKTGLSDATVSRTLTELHIDGLVEQGRTYGTWRRRGELSQPSQLSYETPETVETVDEGIVKDA